MYHQQWQTQSRSHQSTIILTLTWCDLEVIWISIKLDFEQKFVDMISCKDFFKNNFEKEKGQGDIDANDTTISSRS